ncbi:MAG: hypothetical protein K2Q12_01375 [Rickettsiales bacterium]|nr:hypothetical protein [Rickettsiales bacterium]
MTLSLEGLIDGLGWLGALLVLAAYGLLSFKKISSQDMRYHVLNFFGSCMLAVYALYYHAHASVLVNVIWLLIASWAIYRLWRPSRQ